MLIEKLLETDPEQRITLDEALKHKWFDRARNSETMKSLVMGNRKTAKLSEKRIFWNLLSIFFNWLKEFYTKNKKSKHSYTLTILLQAYRHQLIQWDLHFHEIAVGLILFHTCSICILLLNIFLTMFLLRNFLLTPTNARLFFFHFLYFLKGTQQFPIFFPESNDFLFILTSPQKFLLIFRTHTSNCFY